MRVYVSQFLADPDKLLVRARAEGDGVVGDLSRVIGPGEDVFGLTYERAVALGLGEFEIPDHGEPVKVNDDDHP